MLKIKKNIFLGFCLLFVTFIYSQTDFENFQFRSIKEGISKRGVWSIVQDKKGYIWIGTNGAGLYKYDGINYVVYESDWNKPKSLNSNLIYTMYVDSQNELWIGTEEGLCLYDKDLDNFKTFDLKKVLNVNKADIVTVRSLIEDNDKNLLIGTEEYGLLKLNRKTLDLTRIKPNVPIKGNLYISGLAKNKQGKIFVATNFGLKYFDPKRNIIPQLLFLNNDNSKSEITDSLESLYIEGNGDLWVGTTNKGLIKVVKRSIEYKKQNFAITDKRIFSIVAIDEKNILCASENDGLFLVNTSGKIVKKYLPNKFDKNGLKSNSIWSLMKDRDNRIWLGYYNKGVCIFDKLSGQFNSIESLLNNGNSLQTSSVTSIAQDSSGKLWISMEGGGVDVFDPKTKKFIHINNHDNSFVSGLNSNNVQEVFFDSKQNLWLGVWNEGIYFLKKGTKNFVNYSTKNTKGISSDRILSFSEDSKGNVWIASFQWGLSYFDASKNSFFKCDSKPFQDYLLNTAFVRKVFVDSDDIVWVGTTKGLFTVTKKGDTFSVSSMKNEVSKALNSNNSVHTILSIFESKDKIIWVGTDGSGLFNYNKKTKKIKWYNGVKSLQEKSISAIVEDNLGSIWVSGRTGITKLDLKNNKFYNFNTEDGLLINDFNNNSVLKDDKGIIYFGNYEGINYFDPSQMSKSTKQPLLYFNDLKIFNNSVIPGGADSPLEKVISETKKIVLNHNQSIFTLEYIGINYSIQEKTNMLIT